MRERDIETINFMIKKIIPNIFNCFVQKSINNLVWSGGICSVACQESLQEKTATTKGKKVSMNTKKLLLLSFYQD